MTKQDLIAKMAETASLSKKDAGAALDALTASIQEALKKDDKIQLVGFGSWEVRARAARTGRNPQSGTTITIPASKTPAFSAGKALKDALNK